MSWVETVNLMERFGCSPGEATVLAVLLVEIVAHRAVLTTLRREVALLKRGLRAAHPELEEETSDSLRFEDNRATREQRKERDD